MPARCFSGGPTWINWHSLERSQLNMYMWHALCSYAHETKGGKSDTFESEDPQLDDLIWPHAFTSEFWKFESN